VCTACAWVAASTGSARAAAPPCEPAVVIAPERLVFEDSYEAQATQSLTATHPAQLFISLPANDPVSLTEPAIQLTTPTGLQARLSNQGDATRLWAYFTPTTPGPLTFSASWSQLTKIEGPTCTATTSVTVAVQAPTPSRVAHTPAFSVDHRSKHHGSTNEFVLTWYVLSDRLHGDMTPVKMTARAAIGSRRPAPASPATTLTFDPLKGAVRASTPLVHLEARDLEDTPLRYEFQAGVFAYPRGGHGRARRTVEVTFSQGARILTKYRFTTACEAVFGGLECSPRPKRR